jgi:hypothetical protein
MIEHAIRDAANELDEVAGLKMAKAPSPGVGSGHPGWALAWRVRSAAWLVHNRELLETALGQDEPEATCRLRQADVCSILIGSRLPESRLDFLYTAEGFGGEKTMRAMVVRELVD